ncbi:MAG: hypothetical protein R3B54_17020, partial [Bdellovibrionota bacterium]
MKQRSYIAHAVAALLLFTSVVHAEYPGEGNPPPSSGSGYPYPGHAGPSGQGGDGQDLASIIREPLPARNNDRVKALKDRISQLKSAQKGLDTEIGNLRALDPSMQEQELTKLANQHGPFVYSLGDVINPAIPLQQRIANLQNSAGGRMGDLITQYQIELITLEKQRDMRERDVNCAGEVQDDPDGKKLIFSGDHKEKALELFGRNEKAQTARKTYLNAMSRYLGDVIKNCEANSKLVESIKLRFPRLKYPFREISEEDFSQNLNTLIDSAMAILDFEDKQLRAGWGDQLILRGEEILDRYAEDAPVELAPTLKKRLEEIQKDPRLSVHKDARATVALLSGSDQARRFKNFLHLDDKDGRTLSNLTEGIGGNDPFRESNVVTTGQHFTKPSDIAARLHYGHSPKALEALEYQPATNREDARKQLLGMLEATKKPDFVGFFPNGKKPKDLPPLSNESRAAYRRVIEKALAQVDGVKAPKPGEQPYIVQLTEEQTLIKAAKDLCENDVEETLSAIGDYVAKSSGQPVPPSTRVQLLKAPRSYRVLLAALARQMTRDLRTIEIDLTARQPEMRKKFNIEARQQALNDLVFNPSLPKLGALIHAMDWRAVFDLGSTAEAFKDFNPYR